MKKHAYGKKGICMQKQTYKCGHVKLTCERIKWCLLRPDLLIQI